MDRQKFKEKKEVDSTNEVSRTAGKDGVHLIDNRPQTVSQLSANGEVVQPMFTRLVLGSLGVVAGVLAAPVVLPAAAAGTAGTAAGGLLLGAAGYMAGSAIEDHMAPLPKPFAVHGELVDGIYRTGYNYNVRFTKSGAIATVSIRFITDPRAREGMASYMNDLKAKVAQIFDDKMHLTYKGKRFPVKIELDLTLPDRNEDLEGLSYRGAGSTAVTAHGDAGRADARNFHINAKNRALVGAHEIGHHLGLYDEYPDPQAPGRTLYHDHSIMRTIDRHPIQGDPKLMPRHVVQIEREMQAKIQEQLDQEEAAKRFKKTGTLPK